MEQAQTLVEEQGGTSSDHSDKGSLVALVWSSPEAPVGTENLGSPHTPETGQGLTQAILKGKGPPKHPVLVQVTLGMHTGMVLVSRGPSPSTAPQHRNSSSGCHVLADTCHSHKCLLCTTAFFSFPSCGRHK